MAIFLINNESAEDSTNNLEEAFDYLNGCLEGSYEIDEELLDDCTNIVNEATRELKEFRKRWGNQKGARAYDKASDDDKREIDKNSVKFSVGDVQRARNYGRFYGDDDGEYRWKRNMNRLRANVQAKDYLKYGGSKEELKKTIDDAKHSANRELTERIASLIHRSRRRKEKKNNKI